MSKISATIVADSLSPQGDRLISVLVTFPRIILSEINTHRMLSKNTSSSRAIPFNKMVEAIENNPFIPIAWQRSHSGMQGTEYITDLAEIQGKNLMWLAGRDRAIKTAKDLHEADVTKQLANRLLEPFMWTTMLITGSREGWDNFFKLRCPVYKGSFSENTYKSRKEAVNSPYNEFDNFGEMDWLWSNKGQAEIHMMDLAEKIYDAVNESTPIKLNPGEWHIPFADKMDIPSEEYIKITGKVVLKSEDLTKIKVKSSVAMAAKTSYTVVGEEKGLDYEALIGLHDRLLSQDPPHSSPLEHCCRALTDEEYKQFYKGKLYVGDYDAESDSLPMSLNLKDCGWVNNIKGFIPYRYLVDNKLSM